MLILSLTINLFANYSIQVKATEVKSECLSLVDSLKTIGLPAYVAEGVVKSKHYYRTRVGCFKTKGDAIKFSIYLSKDKPYIVKEDMPVQMYYLMVDTLNSGAHEYRPIKIVENSNSSTIILLNRPTTSIGGFFPQNMSVYNFSLNKKLKIENVTGIDVKDSVVFYGAKKIVFDNPDDDSVSTFKNEIASFSKIHSLNELDVRENLFTYGDILPRASITLLYKLNLKKLSSMYQNEIGFDYVNDDFKRMLNTDKSQKDSFLWGLKNLPSVMCGEKNVFVGKECRVFLKSMTESDTRVIVYLLHSQSQ